MTHLPFSCPRTCPAAGDRWCRFRPVLDALGPVRVDSHTVRVAVELRDADALAAAVAALGGQWLGQGEHALYERPEVGLGFRLAGWRYPLVLRADGTLAYDDYQGRWGRVADLDRLQGEYTLALAERRCADLGWQCERQGDRLIVYHPAGGTLTVTAGGEVDADGFVGQGCHDAILTLDLGRVTEAQAKPEYAAVPASVAARQA
jgi:hypothetical protein